MASLTPYQKQVLVNTVLGEAANQGASGMQAVASVIKNRSTSGQFPSDPAAVALQSNQFSANNPAGTPGHNNVAATSSAASRAAALAAVNAVFNGEVPDPTGGALYYHTADTTAPWDANMHQTAQIGQHVFYSPSPVPPMNVPAVASEYANTSLPIPMAPRSDMAQQAVTNPDGSVNWGAFYQGLAAPAQLAAGPTANPVSGDFAALGMQGQNPGLSSALANYAAQPQVGQSLSLGDQLAFNPINAPDSTLAMGSPNANYGDALTNNTSFAAYPQGATADSGAVPLSNFLASIGAAPTVGAPPVTTPVHSVAVGANGQPIVAGTPAAARGLTEAQQLAMLALPAAGGIDTAANPGAGYNNLYGQGSTPGAQYTGQGIAGTAQLPSGVSPGAAAEAQAVAAMGGAGGASSSNNASWADLQRSFGGMTPEQVSALNSQAGAIANPLPSGGGNPGAAPLTPAQVAGRDANMSWQLAAFSPQSSNTGGSDDASQSWANLINSFDGPSVAAAPPASTGTSSVAMNDPSYTAPTTRQVTSQQLNPAYTAWLNNQNSAINGVEGVPSPSLDASGNVTLPSSYLGAQPAVVPAPAQYVPVTKTITVPGKLIPAAPTLGIAAAPPPPVLTKIQQLQAQGMSPSQAYNSLASAILKTNVNTGGYTAGGGNSTGNSGGQDRAGGGLTG